MRNNFWILFVIVFAWLLAGCGSQIQPMATATITAQKTTLKPQPTMTLIPIPTLTPSPTTPLIPLPKDVFDNFQKLSGDCKIKTAFGFVPSGETVDEQIVTDATIGQIKFSLFWNAGDLGLTLLQPDGKLMDQDATKTDPVNKEFTSNPASFDIGLLAKQEYFIRAPQQGVWTARILGKSALTTGSAYMLDVSALDAAQTSFHFDKKEYFPGDAISISASMDDNTSGSLLASPAYIYGMAINVIVEDPAHKRYSFALFDDGYHNDGKANDGAYANYFKNTLTTGIYKFYFQLSGLNKRAGEPFTRECFLAKTVKPIPSPTPDPMPGDESQVCKGTIQASEPVVVRPEGVGGSNSSEYGHYAFYPQAVTTSAGVLVTWHVGFDGQSPQPNAYMRFLDKNLKPIGDVSLLFKRNWIGDSASLTPTNNGIVFSYCGRYNTDDRVTSAFLDPYGRLISEKDWAPTDQDCDGGIAQPVWTGSNLIFAWSHMGEWPVSNTSDVHFSIVDASGNLIAEKKFHLDGWGNPSLLFQGGHILMMVTVTKLGQATQGILHRFDLEGNELGKPTTLNPAEYEVNGKILTGRFGFMFPVSDGWMLFAPSGDTDIYTAHFSEDESVPVFDPVIVHTDFDFVNGFQAIVPYGDGVAILMEKPSGQYVVLFLSKNGTVTQQWLPQKDEQPIYGSLFEHQGRLFLIYTSGHKSGDPLTNQVLLRELQCVP
jgi:hypothetical protein